MPDTTAHVLHELGIHDLCPEFGLGAGRSEFNRLLASCTERFEARCRELGAVDMHWDPLTGRVVLPPGETIPGSYDLLGFTLFLAEIVLAVDDEWRRSMNRLPAPGDLQLVRRVPSEGDT